MSQYFYDNNYEHSVFFEKDDCKTISRLFLYLVVSLTIPYLFLICVSFAISTFTWVHPAVTLVINDSYTPLVILLFLFLSRRISSRRPVSFEEMTKRKFLLLVCASVPLMLIGSLIGNAIATAFGKIIGRDVTNALGTLVEDYPFGLVLVSVIIVAPVFEELMFRKFLIDKLSRFGLSFSVLVSGFVFGTFHGNFYQLFYGCILGFLLGYIYCAYSKVTYCIALHSLINFLGFVCPIYLEKFLSSQSLILNFLAVCYSLLYFACIPFGIIAIFLGVKNAKFQNHSLFSLRGTGVLFKNCGFLFYMIFVTVLLALSVLI